MKKPQANQVLSVNALALQIGKDRRTIAAALQGVKSEGKTSQGFPGWTMKTALAALQAGGSGQVERARLDRARAELAELDLRRKREELVEASEVDEMMQRVASTVRMRLLAVPSAVAPVAAFKSAAAVEAIVRTAIDDALHALTELDKSGA